MLRALAIIFFFFFLSFTSVFAQSCGELCSESSCDPGLTCNTYNICTSLAGCNACRGDQGGYGACEQTINCSNPDGNQGPGTVLVPPNVGSCVDYLGSGYFCCVPAVAPPGGTGVCLDPCTLPEDCSSGYTCTDNVCVADCIGCACEPCTGNSGSPGVCTTSTTCTDYGRNPNDGTGACLGSFICCTNAPTGHTCNLTLPADPIQANTPFSVTLAASPPEIISFDISVTGTGSCSCNNLIVETFASGNAVFPCTCGPAGAGLTLTATSNNANCSANFTIAQDSTDHCQFTISPFIPGDNTVRLYSSIPNENYWIDAHWTGDSDGGLCTCTPEFIATGADGQGSTTCNCGSRPDHVTLTARSFTQNPPGNPLVSCSGYVNLPVDSSDRIPIFCGGSGSNRPLSGIRTAIGCIPASDPIALVNVLVGYLVKIGSLLIFFNFIRAGFIYTTSAGDVKKTALAKDLFQSSLIGLFVIATAIIILNFLGVQILHLELLGFHL